MKTLSGTARMTSRPTLTAPTKNDDFVPHRDMNEGSLALIVSQLRSALVGTRSSLTTIGDKLHGPRPCDGEEGACGPNGLLAELQSCLLLAQQNDKQAAEISEVLA